MASIEKTKIFVATGIMICVLGLGFIAMSGNAALSDGYGERLDISSLNAFSSGASDVCVAQKGTQTCQHGLMLSN